MDWLVSACCGFLLRCFFIRVVLIFNYKFSCTKKFNCATVYSDNVIVETRFYLETGQLVSSEDWLILYGAPYSIEGFSWIYQNHLLTIGVKICNSSNTLQFFHIPPSNVSNMLWKEFQFIIFRIFLNILLVFFVILLRKYLIKFESIKLKCYFTTLLYAVAVNMLFLEFPSKKGFLLTILPMPFSLNQYRGEIGSFYNRSASQTELNIS